jgi:hypothetical protein
VKLIKNAIILGLAGVALHALTRKRLDAAPASASDSAETGSARASAQERRSPAATAEDSPNAAERLQSRQPASGLAGNGRLRAALLDSDAAHGEAPRGTGLADFTRGA